MDRICLLMVTSKEVGAMALIIFIDVGKVYHTGLLNQPLADFVSSKISDVLRSNLCDLAIHMIFDLLPNYSIDYVARQGYLLGSAFILYINDLLGFILHFINISVDVTKANFCFKFIHSNLLLTLRLNLRLSKFRERKVVRFIQPNKKMNPYLLSLI